MKNLRLQLAVITLTILACVLAPLPRVTEVHNGAKRATLAKEPAAQVLTDAGAKVRSEP